MSSSSVSSVIDLLLAGSILTKATEKSWAKSYAPTLTDADVTAVFNLCERIFPRERIVRVTDREYLLRESTSTLLLWLNSSTQIIDTGFKQTYRSLKEKVRFLMHETGFMLSEGDIDYYKAKLRFWWDFENCGVDDMADYSGVGSAIFESCEMWGYKGKKREIVAVGDQRALARNYWDAQDIAVSLTNQHVQFIQVQKVPQTDSTDTADKVMIMHIMDWMNSHVNEYNEGGVLGLATGDVDFRGVITVANEMKFRTLLAYKRDNTNPMLRQEPGNAKPWDIFRQGRSRMRS